MRNIYRCQPKYKVSTAFKPRTAGVPDASWSIPALCTAYTWPRNLPGDGVIALIELGGGWVPADMDAFFKSIDQPMPSITDISVDGTTNTPNQGLSPDPDVEVALDIQVAAASYYVATGKPAVVRVYWSGDIVSAVTAAVNDGCDVCSISWGSDEANWQKSGCDAMEAAATEATNKGMIVLAASGDNDADDLGAGHNVDMPAAAPHVLACGGTQKTTTAEVVWNDNPGNPRGEGTGGGFSKIFPQQGFQANAPNGPGRLVPDVAANADDAKTPYQIVVHGVQAYVGGTSAVAPLYAGLFAAIGRKLGFVTPKLWANQVCFNDITVGDNGYFRAGVGPDPCTGIGSPIGSKIASLFARAG